MSERPRWEAYLDASALIKRYAPERGSRFVNEVFRLIPRRSISCFSIGLLEVTSIFVRMRNDRRLSAELFGQAMSEFMAEFLEDPATQIQPAGDGLALDSLDLVLEHQVNAVDSMILRSVLDVQERLQEEQKLFFVTSDRRLVRAVRAEGVLGFDPERDSLESLQRSLKDAGQG